MKTFIFNTFDKKQLMLYLWDEVENPKGAVQLCHGMSEHLGRYDDFAKFLNKNGYYVFGDDHRSYGQTDNNSGYCEGEYVGDTVKDLLLINEAYSDIYKNLPMIFFGHSYGSCLAQRFIQCNPKIDACIMTGTGTAPGLVCKIAQIILAPINLLFGKVKLGFPEQNKGFLDTDVPHAWLTKDKEIRKQYFEDPLSGGKSSIAYYYGFLKMMAKNASKKNLKKIDKDLPIGIFCGKDDPCGGKGKMPVKLGKTYKKIGIKNVFVKLYENDRHEILNETDRDVVYKEILEFMNKCIEK